MGRPKLLLEVAGRPLILHTLAAWRASRVDQVVVVVRPDDQLLSDLLRQVGVELAIAPAPPPDMKASLAVGLAHVAARYQPSARDCWLVAPADMPGLSPPVIDSLLAQAELTPRRVLIPTLGGRRGHPVLLSWTLAAGVANLAAGEGLHSLIDRSEPCLIACDDCGDHPAQAFADIDTPDDLAQFRQTAIQTPCLPPAPQRPVH